MLNSFLLPMFLATVTACAPFLRRQRCVAFVLLALSTGIFSAHAAAKATIQEVRLRHSPDNTRIVFDLDKPIEHKIFTIKNPDRIVLDIPNAVMNFDSSRVDLKNSPVRLLRSASRNNDDLRVVLDLNESVSVGSFILKKNGAYSDRLVLDIKVNQGAGKKQKATKTAAASKKSKRDLIVAIDAGHGGEDPGALGPGRVYEKRVVYAIAKKLAQQFDSQKGYKAVMVRSGDYYVGLSKRRDIAREYKADMFISIHADAFTSPQAHGASVYALSSSGASSASARFLADRENKADLVGGVSISDKDALLSSVLVDLSMAYKMESSLDVGKAVLKEMGKLTRLHSKRVEQAAFAVLKTPDIPSILVETGFISNPTEAKNLNSRTYQKKMASAIYTGVDKYFRVKAPEGSYIAATYHKHLKVSQYVVQSGDTLSGIASQYQMSMKKLRKHNRLSSTALRVGQVLKIPST